MIDANHKGEKKNVDNFLMQGEQITFFNPSLVSTALGKK